MPPTWYSRQGDVQIRSLQVGVCRAKPWENLLSVYLRRSQIGASPVFMSRTPAVFALAFASFLLSACDKDDDASGVKSAAAAGADETKSNTPAKSKPVEEKVVLVLTDVTEHAKKHMPGFGGALKLEIPKGAEFSAGVGKMVISKGAFALSIGTGFRVAARKKKLADGGLYKQVKFIDESEEHLLFSAKMFGKQGFFVATNAPAFGGLISSCETGMGGAKTEAVARKVLQACKSLQYTK